MLWGGALETTRTQGLSYVLTHLSLLSASQIKNPTSPNLEGHDNVSSAGHERSWARAEAGGLEYKNQFQSSGPSQR